MSALGLAALSVAQADLAAGIRGGQPGRFQSPDVALRLAAVGIDYPAPWCAAEMFHCFAQATIGQDANPCPRTPSAVHLFKNAPDSCKRILPAPGDVFVLEHRDGWSGHCGIVEAVSPDGQAITTIEGDTNAQGSATGDAMGRHTWTPADGKRGKLLGYLELS
ncbi:MAG TPA: CHAP domain-containing protein [Tepidiformaceae bacterium]|nr:CHAP domain-containing protein [Tepidiformaceae bacterium]